MTIVGEREHADCRLRVVTFNVKVSGVVELRVRLHEVDRGLVSHPTVRIRILPFGGAWIKLQNSRRGDNGTVVMLCYSISWSRGDI